MGTSTATAQSFQMKQHVSLEKIVAANFVEGKMAGGIAMEGCIAIGQIEKIPIA
jgi:hypothetical protein